MAEQAGRNVRDLRRSNRSLLLRHLYFHEQVSRQELSRATGLSTATVSNVVAELIDDGLVVEAGAVESEGGRPRILLEIAASRFQVIGVDVGETHVRVERFSLTLDELARSDVPVTPGRYSPETVVAGIAAGLAAVAPTGADPDGGAGELLGVGVGVPGIVHGGPDPVVHCQTFGWDGVPLAALLRGVTDLPLFIDNGATTMGQAEVWFGAGREASDSVFLLIGSGVGASVMVGGVPYRGSTTSAGEWGHITAVIGGRRCRCGARGCLEAYTSAESVIARYREAGGTALTEGSGQEAALRQILDDAGSAAAAEVLDTTALHIGVGIGNLVNLFNPERVIIGGWAGLLLGDRLLPRIREVARDHALHYPFSRTTIELCQLGADAVARGAATLPVARFLGSGGPVPRPPLTTSVPRFRTRP
ncbi:ROK family transcriptional regulator [Streptacidiphilus cavernicola]|uniref:ROK family transcriptional regulator n=1 Tax=Streptacidiphilus cavernicola TaxID=3342716 RepID=A0ABV6W0Y1_9ACTN